MANEFQVTGAILRIGETQTSNSADKTYFKRNFVIETIGEQYPQQLQFEVNGEAPCENIEKYNKVGDVVKVCFNLKGRDYKKKDTGETGNFTTLQSWRIEKVTAEATAPAATTAETNSPLPLPNKETTPTAGSEDLPF